VWLLILGLAAVLKALFVSPEPPPNRKTEIEDMYKSSPGKSPARTTADKEK
jgi:hypothetical protein